MKKTFGIAPCTLAVLAIFAGGCAGPVAPEGPGTAGTSHGGSGSVGPGGSSGTGGARPDPIGTLPGVDVPLDVVPNGCLGGFVAGALNLILDAAVPSVHLEGAAGKLVVNGTVCTDASDAEVTLASISSLHVTGTDAQQNAVIWDLGTGDWSSLLATPESIQLALGTDENSFVLRGTSGPDFVRHGARGLDLVLDLVGEGAIHVVGSGVTRLGVSLGAGDDRLDDLAELLDTRAAEAADAGVPVQEDPAAEPPVPVVALFVPLVAEGGEGNDWLLGGSGNDEFDGGPGDDVVSGLAGNDTLRTGAASDGADTFNGGPGYDDVTYELRTVNLNLNICISESAIGCDAVACDCTTLSGEAGEGDRLINVEDVTGGEGNDTINGSAAADSLSGGPGDDELFGLGGSDVLYGQRGDDTFDGGPDGDYCDGVPGEQISSCEL
jgi:Ca2+-binding RTX toxin-like protein